MAVLTPPSALTTAPAAPTLGLAAGRRASPGAGIQAHRAMDDVAQAVERALARPAAAGASLVDVGGQQFRLAT